MPPPRHATAAGSQLSHNSAVQQLACPTTRLSHSSAVLQLGCLDRGRRRQGWKARPASCPLHLAHAAKHGAIAGGIREVQGVRVGHCVRARKGGHGWGAQSAACCWRAGAIACVPPIAGCRQGFWRSWQSQHCPPAPRRESAPGPTSASSSVKTSKQQPGAQAPPPTVIHEHESKRAGGWRRPALPRPTRVSVHKQLCEGHVCLQDVQQLEAQAGAVDGEDVACRRGRVGPAGGWLGARGRRYRGVAGGAPRRRAPWTAGSARGAASAAGTSCRATQAASLASACTCPEGRQRQAHHCRWPPWPSSTASVQQPRLQGVQPQSGSGSRAQPQGPAVQQAGQPAAHMPGGSQAAARLVRARRMHKRGSRRRAGRKRPACGQGQRACKACSRGGSQGESIQRSVRPPGKMMPLTDLKMRCSSASLE